MPIVGNMHECSESNELPEKDNLDNDETSMYQPRTRQRSKTNPHYQKSRPKPELHVTASTNELNKAHETMTLTIDTSSKADSGIIEDQVESLLN